MFDDKAIELKDHSIITETDSHCLTLEDNQCDFYQRQDDIFLQKIEGVSEIDFNGSTEDTPLRKNFVIKKSQTNIMSIKKPVLIKSKSEYIQQNIVNTKKHRKSSKNMISSGVVKIDCTPIMAKRKSSLMVKDLDQFM